MPTWSRRTALQTIGSTLTLGLAGCSTITGSSPATSKTNSSSKNPFRFDATILNSTPTAQRPPVIQVMVTNRDEKAHTLTISNNAFPFGTAQATGDGNSLVLSEEIPSTREGECWTGFAKVLAKISGQKFAPDESVSRKYAVLNAKTPGKCWPPGSFEFTETYYLDPVDANSTKGREEFKWGFTLVVNDDNSITLKD